MDDVPGMIRPDLQALPQVRDRMTFLVPETLHAGPSGRCHHRNG